MRHNKRKENSIHFCYCKLGRSIQYFHGKWLSAQNTSQKFKTFKCVTKADIIKIKHFSSLLPRPIWMEEIHGRWAGMYFRADPKPISFGRQKISGRRYFLWFHFRWRTIYWKLSLWLLDSSEYNCTAEINTYCDCMKQMNIIALPKPVLILIALVK